MPPSFSVAASDLAETWCVSGAVITPLGRLWSQELSPGNLPALHLEHSPCCCRCRCCQNAQQQFGDLRSIPSSLSLCSLPSSSRITANPRPDEPCKCVHWSELIPLWTSCLDDLVALPPHLNPESGGGGRIRMEAMAPPVLEVVTLLVGKRNCGQHRRECRGQKEGRAAGLEPDGAR